MTEAKPIGEVVHYFDKIGVAIVKVSKPLAVGDELRFKTSKGEFNQKIGSMQIDHIALEKVKSGDEFGLKVDQEVREGDEVLPA